MKIFKKDLKSVVNEDGDGGYISSVTSSPYIFIVEDDFKNLLNNLPVTKELVNGDKLFIPPYVSFSRQKLTSYLRDRPKINKVRNIINANKVVLSKKILEDYIRSFKYNYAYIFKNGKDLTITHQQPLVSSKRIIYFIETAKEELEESLKILENINGKSIITPEVLHDITTQDNVITYGEYKSICNLLDSSDTTMHDIGILTIFTSNIEKSLFYILLLTTRYYSTHIQYNSNSTRVAIKPVLDEIMRRYDVPSRRIYGKWTPKEEMDECITCVNKILSREGKLYIDKNLFQKIISAEKQRITKNVLTSYLLSPVKVPDVNPEVYKNVVYEK